MSPAPLADWIAVDWGTTRLRAWAMAGDRTVRAEGSSENGMGALQPEQFEAALLELVSPWLRDGVTDVVACGMVGSRQGWMEAAYGEAPCRALGSNFARPHVNDPRLRVHIIPGIKQVRMPDVMRGEETQIAGFLALNEDWDGVVCLPGTHTKWVHVSAGEVVSFQTFMTGELFSLIARHSVLRHSIAPVGWDDDAFAEALADTLSKPEAIAARLFGLRAADLLTGQSSDTARARLSGLLIGTELAAARPYWLGQQVAVIGAPDIARTYTMALSEQGVAAIQADGPRMTLAGLTAAYASL